MRKPALEDALYRDSQGDWTGHHGISSRDDFLDSPRVQEQAIADYLETVRGYLETNKAAKRIDQNIIGIKAPFTVTESGLVAAAHGQGAEGVRQYLDYLESMGWKSDVDKIADEDTRRKFLAIETRLRRFASTPLRRDRTR